MKILLTTLNAKYVHSNLALRYLRAVCPEEEVMIQEYTINDRLDVIAGEIYRTDAAVVGFSCYIWNLAPTLELVGILRQVSPSTVIVLGGPEVSYDPAEYVKSAAGADIVVCGEGEETWRELIASLKGEGLRLDAAPDLSRIKGIAYRSPGGPAVNPPRTLIRDLGSVPSPYTAMDGLENKIAYIESTRGCPFNCQYCLSSTFQGVRYFPLQQTKQELERLVGAGVRQIKFVDRTFNCSKTHAMEIMTFLAAWNPPANFHFEISADLLDEEMLGFLKGVPPGLFQFEVGVQSTNPATLDLIQRRTDLALLEKNVRAISAAGNIMQLVDLIAGLPAEDYQSFARSFNTVYSWGPDKLQLGFLKLLKGSGIRERGAEWGYKFTASPPYRVLANNLLSYADVLKLEIIEDMVEKFFNSGRFKHTLSYLIEQFQQDPFACFEELAGFWRERGYQRLAHSAQALFELLLEFYRRRFSGGERLFAGLLKLDYLLWNKPVHIPAWFPLEDFPCFKQRADAFFRAGLPQLLPQVKQVSRRELQRYFHLEPFAPEVLQYLGMLEMAGDGPCLLFYYPGPLLQALRPGFMPAVI